MEQGKLSKIERITDFIGPAPLRTPTVLCGFMKRPTVGNQFVVFAKALEDGEIRLVATSPVTEIVKISEEGDGPTVTFRTANSMYELLITDVGLEVPEGALRGYTNSI